MLFCQFYEEEQFRDFLFASLDDILYLAVRLRQNDSKYLAQSVGHLTHKSGVLGSIPGLATYFRFSFRFFKKGSYWPKYVHEVLVNRLGDLSLPRKSVVRLTDRPDMTLDVYRGRKTTMQQQQQIKISKLVLWNYSIEVS